MVVEDADKKIKVLRESKLVKDQDDIVSALRQVRNSNATVSKRSPQLEAQVKIEFNPEK